MNPYTMLTEADAALFDRQPHAVQQDVLQKLMWIVRIEAQPRRTPTLRALEAETGVPMRAIETRWRNFRARGLTALLSPLRIAPSRTAWHPKTD